MKRKTYITRQSTSGAILNKWGFFYEESADSHYFPRNNITKAYDFIQGIDFT